LVHPLRHLNPAYLTEVFEVEDIQSSDRKVLKSLTHNDRKLIELFQREADVLQRLNHPGIPKVDAIGCFHVKPSQWQEPLHCLVMERIDGEDLQQWMMRHPPIAQPLAIAWLRQLIDILHQIHQSHLFHRDIKPSNIMLCPAEPWGRLVLIDFGTVREVSRTVIEGRDSTVVYSDGYTAPEQIRGRATPQSDFYALGRTFIHLMTQTHPNELPEDEYHHLEWHDRAPQIAPLLAYLISDLADENAIARPRNTRDLLERMVDVETALTPQPIFQYSNPDLASVIASPEDVTSLDITRPPIEHITHRAAVSTQLQPPSILSLQSIWQGSRRSWRLLCGGLVLLLILLLLGWGRREWQRQQVVIAQRLLAQAELLQPPAGQDLTGGLRLAIEAWQRLRSLNLPTLPAEQLLQQGLAQLPQSRHQLTFEDDVNVTALSPSGRWWAAASQDGTIQLWDTQNPTDIQTLPHNGAVTAIAFSSDDRYLVSASHDQTVQIMNLSNPEATTTLTQDEPVQAIALASDSSYVVTIGLSTISVWTMAGEPIEQQSLPDTVTTIALHPTQPQVAIALSNGAVLQWNWQTSDAPTAILQLDSTIHAIAYSPDGSRLATGSRDQTARLWNLTPATAPNTEQSPAQTTEPPIEQPTAPSSTSPTEQQQWRHNHAVVQVAFSPDGQFLATATGSPLPLGNDHIAQVFSLETRRAIAQVSHQGSITDLKFGPDGMTLATSSFDRTARVWDIEQSELISHIRHNEAVMQVEFGADGRSLATASLDNTAQLWELSGNPVLVALEQPGNVLAIGFSPDGQTVAVGTNNHLSLWTVDGALIQRWDIDAPIHTIQVSSTGQIGTVNQANALQIWSPNRDRIVELRLDETVNAIAFSPDGNAIATASADNTARIWEVSSGLELAQLDHDSFVESVSFSPDGTLVATASLDNTARVWDWQQTSPLEVARLEHDSFVESVIFSPDGTRLATASLDNTARIWDWTNNNPELRRFQHTQDVQAIAFSPNGEQLATLSGAGLLQPTLNDRVQVWDINHNRVVLDLSDQALLNMAGFSADGQHIATTSRTQGIQIWHISTGEEVSRLNLAEGARRSHFSPTDPLLGVLGTSNQVWLWSWRSEDLIHQACDRLSQLPFQHESMSRPNSCRDR
jgi:WD40 repeat protein/serine/threonine protein kinase